MTSGVSGGLEPHAGTLLPPAAQRWLERALPHGAPSLVQAVVEQRGEMEASDRWLAFKARGTYGIQPLSFDWRARLRVMPGIWVIARDGHADDEGWGGAKLWGLRSIGERSGPEVLAMQVIRNIAELAWLPGLARADSSLTWHDAGVDAFEISRQAGAREVTVRFEVTAAGDIIRASCADRPYDVPGGFEEAPWRCDLSEPSEFDGVRIPSGVVATYDFEDDPWEYFRAQITSVTGTADTH